MLKTNNTLLMSLPAQTCQSILEAAEPVKLDLCAELIAHGEPIFHIYFVETGVVSIVAHTSEGSIVELVTIGHEGMVGVFAALDLERSYESAIVQVEGSALRIETAKFIGLVRAYPKLAQLCQRYIVELFHNIASNTACNMMHSANQRCAKWLLVTQQRCGNNTFTLTQEFLAIMIGVSRTSVNKIAGRLAKEGLITYARGRITVADREGLKEVSCDCYTLLA